MKKIILLVSDEEVETAYSELTSTLDYENIAYSVIISDLTDKENKVE